jgi:hypothetical protein
MNAPATLPEPLLDAFTERANARAYLWSVGEYELHDAIDQLQGDANRDGIVHLIGTDAVQAILASAFRPYRDRHKEPDSEPQLPTCDLSSAAQPERRDRLEPAASSIQAFCYLVKVGDPHRLRSWLGHRSAAERAAFKKMLVPK